MMKRGLKRWMAVLMAALLCMAPVQALAEEDAYLSVANEWIATLYDQEQIYESMSWMLDYAEKFCETRSWADLLNARTAVAAAADRISRLEFAPASLKAADYMPFLKQGYELSFVMDAFGLMEQARQDALNSCMMVESLLNINVFWAYDFEYMQSQVASLRKMMKYDMLFLGNQSNYICLVSEDSAMRASLQEFFVGNLPTIFGAYAGWMEDASIIAALKENGNTEEAAFTPWLEDAALSEQLAAAILDCYEDAFADFEALNAVGEENLNSYYRVLESGDWSELMDNHVDISGLPLMIPDPGWYAAGNTVFEYFWEDAEEQVHVARVGDALTDVPTGCFITCPGVSREAFDSYAAALADLGIEAVEKEEAGEGRRLFYLFDTCDVVADWTEEGAMIYCMEEVACFVPLWYLMAQL